MPTVTKTVVRPGSQSGRTPISRSSTIVVAGGERVAKYRSAWEVNDSIRMLLYGRSGTGKSTLASTFPSPILWIVCSGGQQPGELKSVDTPENRERITPLVAERTTDVRGMLEMAGDYATVVLDHASGLQDLTLKEILGIEELPVQRSWGMASQQQYGQSSLQTKEILRAMLSLPRNVVIIAQERTFGDEANSDIITPTVGAALTPSVTGWLGPACDYVVQTFIRPKVEVTATKVAGQTTYIRKRVKGKGGRDEVEYVLRTAPHDVFMTKFRVPRGRELPEVIIDPDYSKILAVIRGEAVEEATE